MISYFTSPQVVVIYSYSDKCILKVFVDNNFIIYSARLAQIKRFKKLADNMGERKAINQIQLTNKVNRIQFHKTIFLI